MTDTGLTDLADNLAHHATLVCESIGPHMLVLVETKIAAISSWPSDATGIARKLDSHVEALASTEVRLRGLLGSRPSLEASVTAHTLWAAKLMPVLSEAHAALTGIVTAATEATTARPQDDEAVRLLSGLSENVLVPVLNVWPLTLNPDDLVMEFRNTADVAQSAGRAVRTASERVAKAANDATNASAATALRTLADGLDALYLPYLADGFQWSPEAAADFDAAMPTMHEELDVTIPWLVEEFVSALARLDGADVTERAVKHAAGELVVVLGHADKLLDKLGGARRTSQDQFHLLERQCGAIHRGERPAPRVTSPAAPVDELALASLSGRVDELRERTATWLDALVRAVQAFEASVDLGQEVVDAGGLAMHAVNSLVASLGDSVPGIDGPGSATTDLDVLANNVSWATRYLAYMARRPRFREGKREVGFADVLFLMPFGDERDAYRAGLEALEEACRMALAVVDQVVTAMARLGATPPTYDRAELQDYADAIAQSIAQSIADPTGDEDTSDAESGAESAASSGDVASVGEDAPATTREASEHSTERRRPTRREKGKAKVPWEFNGGPDTDEEVGESEISAPDSSSRPDEQIAAEAAEAAAGEARAQPGPYERAEADRKERQQKPPLSDNDIDELVAQNRAAIESTPHGDFALCYLVRRTDGWERAVIRSRTEPSDSELAMMMNRATGFTNPRRIYVAKGSLRARLRRRSPLSAGVFAVVDCPSIFQPAVSRALEDVTHGKRIDFIAASQVDGLGWARTPDQSV